MFLRAKGCFIWLLEFLQAVAGIITMCVVHISMRRILPFVQNAPHVSYKRR